MTSNKPSEIFTHVCINIHQFTHVCINIRQFTHVCINISQFTHVCINILQLYSSLQVLLYSSELAPPWRSQAEGVALNMASGNGPQKSSQGDETTSDEGGQLQQALQLHDQVTNALVTS